MWRRELARARGTGEGPYPRIADPRPAGADGHPLRLEGRHALGGPPAGDGLRLGGHPLAAPGWVAASGLLAAAARSAAGEAQRSRSRSTGRGLGSTPPTCAPLRGERTGPSPEDRRKPGSRHHPIKCGTGNPLAARPQRETSTTWHPSCPGQRRPPI